ncbi:15940_t:CDS:2 [Acaulospora morrowiae]|uniref:15940_t:CDS:1 n=1 Tax=Acaulospora morrowiae TaxID=94023 RepID=A0A9N9GK66_9GLOM|nr:15940_t:CDS:2 [Acaulospora morrowiae]
MPNLVDFPFEILVEICSYVDIYSLYALSTTCKDLVFVIKHPPFWCHIEFTNPEERGQIQRDFLCSAQTKPRIPQKLLRITDESMQRLFKMLRKNRLEVNVITVNLDFTSVTSSTVLKLIDTLPNIEEISLRGCRMISLRGLGDDISWFVDKSKLEKLKRLNVLWCKDMDPRVIQKKANALYVYGGVSFYKNVYKAFVNSFVGSNTKEKIELDIGICKKCQENIGFTVDCASCQLPKTFCMSCDLNSGCLDCFRFYCCTKDHVKKSPISPNSSSSVTLTHLATDSLLKYLNSSPSASSPITDESRLICNLCFGESLICDTCPTVVRLFPSSCRSFVSSTICLPRYPKILYITDISTALILFDKRY